MAKKLSEGLLVGEDRNFGGNLLFVDLIPSSCWFTNVRGSVSKEDWDRLRKIVYKRANFSCEVCGENGKMEAHERFEYNEQLQTQTLKRLICLCDSCHLVTHFGHANVVNRGEEARQHLMKVRKWNVKQANKHLETAFRVWRERSQKDWELDLFMLLEMGIEVKTIPPYVRRRKAQKTEKSLH